MKSFKCSFSMYLDVILLKNANYFVQLQIELNLINYFLIKEMFTIMFYIVFFIIAILIYLFNT